jgi:hypothetical protein
MFDLEKKIKEVTLRERKPNFAYAITIDGCFITSTDVYGIAHDIQLYKTKELAQREIDVFYSNVLGTEVRKLKVRI